MLASQDGLCSMELVNVIYVFKVKMVLCSYGHSEISLYVGSEIHSL